MDIIQINNFINDINVMVNDSYDKNDKNKLYNIINEQQKFIPKIRNEIVENNDKISSCNNSIYRLASALDDLNCSTTSCDICNYTDITTDDDDGFVYCSDSEESFCETCYYNKHIKLNPEKSEIFCEICYNEDKNK